MERVERENVRAEARRPIRKVHMYADQSPANVAPAIQHVMGPEEKVWLFGEAPTDWRIVHRKPVAAFQPQKGYYEEREETLARLLPTQMAAAFPSQFAATEANVPGWAAKQLHHQRRMNVEEDFGSKLKTPQRSPTPKEKSEKRIRKKRRDPLYTSVHYPGDTPRK